MRVTIDLGHRPDLTPEELIAVLQGGLGEGCEISKTGRLTVPDVMVKRSDVEGAAVQILQQRRRKRTRLRVYGLAPSVARRGWTPIGLVMQAKRTKPLVERVASILGSSEELRRQEPAAG